LARELRNADFQWDERLAIAVVDLASGRRVMLSAEGSPRASLVDAVLASCAIPGVFRPIEIAGRRYVDGGVWSPTNLDTTAVTQGDRVLCLNPTGSFQPKLSSPIGALGTVSRLAAASEALTLQGRGAQVTVINPDAVCASLMGTDLMNPRARASVIKAGLAQGRRLRFGIRHAPAEVRLAA